MTLLRETSVVLAVGLALGFGAHALHPEGLELGRNYFPSVPLPPSAASPSSTPGRHGGAPEAQAGSAPDATPSTRSPGGASPLESQVEALADTAAVTTPGEQPSPDGLSPGSPGEQVVEAEATAPALGPDGRPPLDDVDPTDPVVARLAEKTLQAIGRRGTEALFRDPLYAYDAYLFVDARDDEHYAEGHIPGAWQLDRFQPEAYLPAIEPLLPSAMQVVVYCNGGDCDDSEYAAIELLYRGADPARVWVFTGGITAWREAGLPIERGARHSGDLLEEQP